MQNADWIYLIIMFSEVSLAIGICIGDAMGVRRVRR